MASVKTQTTLIILPGKKKKKKLKETIGIINSVFIYKELFLFGCLENH